MKLVTRFELVSKTTPELHALYCVIFNELAGHLVDCPEQRNSLASLENIRRELGARPPGF